MFSAQPTNWGDLTESCFQDIIQAVSYAIEQKLLTEMYTPLWDSIAVLRVLKGFSEHIMARREREQEVEVRYGALQRGRGNKWVEGQ